MFPHLENPFAKPPSTPRSPDDPALIGKILGPEEEAAMREALGETGHSLLTIIRVSSTFTAYDSLNTTF